MIIFQFLLLYSCYLGEIPIICTIFLCCVFIPLAVLGMTVVKLHPGHGVLTGHWLNEVNLNMTYLEDHP